MSSTEFSERPILKTPSAHPSPATPVTEIGRRPVEENAQCQASGPMRVREFELLKLLGKGSFGAPLHHTRCACTAEPPPSVVTTPAYLPARVSHTTQLSLSKFTHTQARSTRRAAPRTRRRTPSRRYISRL